MIPTLVVLLAVAAMIGLGLWQLQRARWKEGLIAQYAGAARLPPLALSGPPDAKAPPLFRRATAHCFEVVEWSAKAGRNARGESGWSHIARCRTGAEGPGLSADVGWSRDANPPAWRGGELSGQLAPDTRYVYRLVLTRPAPGLEPSAPPSLADVPNNHRGYAVQWFVFAGVAALIYLLALRGRKKPLPGSSPG